MIELFKGLYAGLRQKAYGYVNAGGLLIRHTDTMTERQVSGAEAKSYIDSYPDDLAGYQQLSLTVQGWDRQKKEKDNGPVPRGFGM